MMAVKNVPVLEFGLVATFTIPHQVDALSAQRGSDGMRIEGHICLLRFAGKSCDASFRTIQSFLCLNSSLHV